MRSAIWLVYQFLECRGGKRGTHVLVDEDDGDVAALLGEGVEGVLDLLVGRFVVDYEVVFLGVWAFGYVLVRRC